MKAALRLLLVEDSEDDEFLIKRELAQTEFSWYVERVTTPQALKQALQTSEWDLIISDYRLPGFSGLDALTIFQESKLDIPFIVLSGMIGEDLAVEMMKKGAHDYIMKNALKRLPRAVEREIRESRSRKAQRASDAENRLLTRYYQLLSQTNQAIVRILDPSSLLSTIASIAVHIGGFIWSGFATWSDNHWQLETSFGEETREPYRPFAEVNSFPFTSVIHASEEPLNVYGLFPIRIQGRPWGAFLIKTQEDQLSEEEIKLMSALAADVAFALEARFESQFRRELDRQLAQERERLSLILESMADGILALDSLGKIAFLNQNCEQLLGWENHQASFANEELPPEILAITGIKTIPFVNKVGKALALEVGSTTVSNRQGSGISRVFLLRDVSEQEKTDERLRQLEKMESIGLLAGGIAHDFNNLLTGIFGFLQLAKMNSTEPTKVEMYLERALNPFNRARNLTQQLLTFAKGGQPLKKRFNIADMVKNISEFTLSGSSIVLTNRQDDEAYYILGNEAQLGQVFENLLMNAKQAMPQGGSLNLSMAKHLDYERSDLKLERGDYLEVAFEDTGCGIPPESLKKIFDPFFTTKKEGTGLGLSICFSVLRKHGGAIEADSVMGRGSTFRVYLPLLTAEEETNTQTLPSSAGQGLVLFLDDEEYARSIAASMLERLGYAVEVFEHGEQLETAYQEHQKAGVPIGAMILDLTIKGGPGGLDVLKSLKQIDPQVTAIASSGYSNESALIDPLKYGFSGSLPKPFSMDELSEVLVSALKKSAR
ncbi:MAG: response regulator [Spirochaetales bacterium]|nr:response regulator [Spirochaetales bacterium]